MTVGNVGRWGKGGYIALTLHSFFILSTYFGFLFLDVYPRFQHICSPCNSTVHHKSHLTERIPLVSFHTVLKWIGFISTPLFLQYACIMYYFVFKSVKGERIWRRDLLAFAAMWMRCPYCETWSYLAGYLVPVFATPHGYPPMLNTQRTSDLASYYKIT